MDISQLRLQDINLKHKIIPLTNTVYALLDYYETQGITVMLPTSKPYKKIEIIELLVQILQAPGLSSKEKEVLTKQLQDFLKDSHSIEFLKESSENAFLMLGSGAQANFRKGFGDEASWSTTNLIAPYTAGDLGANFTFYANLNVGIEQLSPDLFYQSYTTNGNVHFPYENYGYSFLPYQFQYETGYIHYNRGWSPPVDDKIQLALLYQAECNASWLDGALELGFNNQKRSWGHLDKNLLLSANARNFPGIEMKIEPFNWFRYSFVFGSLFWLPAEHSSYRQNVYKEDLGRFQKMLTLHKLEIMPTRWLLLTGANNAIWAKRMEPAYMLPFVPPSLVQDNLGDQDNPALYFDVALRFKTFGKAWFGFYVDDFSLTNSWQMLKYVTNKYAWQAGWRSNILAALLPGTTSTLNYTRVTPFVYTHYPEADFSTGTGRPIDMTYSHDGFNLGFYLPPNSSELSWKLVNVSIPDLVLSLENKMITHGTSDLASDNIYQIYGDIYHHHEGNINNYPMLDFTNDGIYDFTFLSELKFNWKLRTEKSPIYYRLTGSLGYSSTHWESNNSKVAAPLKKQLFTGSLGILVEIY